MQDRPLKDLPPAEEKVAEDHSTCGFPKGGHIFSVATKLADIGLYPFEIGKDVSEPCVWVSVGARLAILNLSKDRGLP